MPSTSNETTANTGDTAKYGNNTNNSNNMQENCSDSKKHDTNNNNDNNPFRTTIIRYCGYTNEVGESFRYQYPKYVTSSYIIAFGYCLCDTLYCGYQSYNNNYDEKNNKKSSYNTDSNTTSSTSTTPLPAQAITKSVTATETTTETTTVTTNTITNRTSLVLYTMVDTMIWQTLASVLLPGIAINTIVKCTRYLIGTARTSTTKSDSSTTKSKSIVGGSTYNKQNLQLPLIRVRHWIPTIVGLVSIPMIIHPIDTAVDTLLDNTIRHKNYSNWKQYKD